MAKPPKVEILSISPQVAARVRAVLSLKVVTRDGQFIFHECRAIEDQPGAPLWVSPPQERRGRHCYTLCQWPPEVRRAINHAVRAHFAAEGGQLQ